MPLMTHTYLGKCKKTSENARRFWKSVAIFYFNLFILSVIIIYVNKKLEKASSENLKEHQAIAISRETTGFLHGGQILSRNQTSWAVKEKVVCQEKKDFQIGYLKAERKLPIFLHQPDNDIHISRVILNGGSWEKRPVNKLVNMMAQYPGAIFIDIGSHIGVYSLTIASYGHRVIAIDCFKGNVERLCVSAKNAKLSKNVTIIHNALSNIRREMLVKVVDPRNVGSISVIPFDEKEKDSRNSSFRIQAIKLDDLMEIMHINIAILKIDVEGHEDNVLRGGENFFRQVKVPFILMEFHFHRNRESGKFIHTFLDRHNLYPDLPDGIPLSNQTEWPWNVEWREKNNKK